MATKFTPLHDRILVRRVEQRPPLRLHQLDRRARLRRSRHGLSHRRRRQSRYHSSMATCLYAAILSDTGSFTYSSTTADTFALVHHLTARGANPSQIARDIYLSNPASKIRLLGIALSNLQTEGDLAWTWVTSEDMDRIGAVAEDCEGVVNYLISIAGVESAVFLREDGRRQPVPFEHPQQGKARCRPDRRALRRWRPPERQRLYDRRPPWGWPQSASSPSYGQDSDSLVSLRIDK